MSEQVSAQTTETSQVNSSTGLPDEVVAGWVRGGSGEWVSATAYSELGESETSVPQEVLAGVGLVAVEGTELEAGNQETEDTQQFDKNLELLKSSELGVLYSEAYKAAVKRDPRLSQINIVSLNEDERGKRSSAVAIAADKSESGKHEAHVRLGRLDESLALMEDTLESVPGLSEFIAESLVLDPSEVTPALLHVFVFLHEIGHLREFMDFESKMPELRDRQQAEKAMLPLKGARTSDIINPSSYNGKYVRDNWDKISVAYQVGSIEDLAMKMNSAHRDMTSERKADGFAIDILNTEPELLDQFGARSLDKYRYHESLMPSAA